LLAGQFITSPLPEHAGRKYSDNGQLVGIYCLCSEMKSAFCNAFSANEAIQQFV